MALATSIPRDCGCPYPDSNGALRGKRCQVCNEKASGNFFGALVCLPCKTFFIRCSSEEVSTFRCRMDFNCEISGSKRSKCKYCRYRKCVEVGMARKERPEHVEAADGQQLCVVCRDVANGVHFGIVSCEGCKKFFRRGLQESDSYMCKQSATCVINPKTRNDCRFCRFQKCLRAGMSRDAIKMGRPRKQMRDIQDSDCLLNPLTGVPFHNPFLTAFGQHNQAAIYRASELVGEHDRTGAATAYSFHPYYAWCGRQLASRGCFKSTAYDYRAADLAFAYSAYLPRASPLSPYAAYGGPQWAYTPQRHASFASTSGSESDSSDRSHEDNECVSPVTALPAALAAAAAAAAPGNESNAQAQMMKRQVPFAIIEPCRATPKTPESRIAGTSKAELRMARQAPTPISDTEREVWDDDEKTFAADYWLWTPDIGRPSVWCEQYTQQAERVVNSYLAFVNDFCKPEQDIADDTKGDSRENLPKLQEEELKTGIIDKMSQVINFIKSLPGFAAVNSLDQYVILRLGWIQVMGLVAAINLYEPNAHAFRRDICAQRRLASGSPLSRFSDSLLAYARAVYRLQLNTVEAALITSLVVMATDWPGLREPSVLQNSRTKLLATLQAYINGKYGASSGRLQEIFRHIPELRQLGLWHYRITFQLWVKAD